MLPMFLGSFVDPYLSLSDEVEVFEVLWMSQRASLNLRPWLFGIGEIDRKREDAKVYKAVGFAWQAKKRVMR
jgi:hypothetical protein